MVTSAMVPVDQIVIRLKAQLAKTSRRFQGAEVIAESLVWIAAWLLIPIYLARSNEGAGTFAGYAAGAGLLISIGVLATNRESFGGGPHFLGHALRCCLAILAAGGAVFLLASWWPSEAHI